jgi:hypothetical protein
MYSLSQNEIRTIAGHNRTDSSQFKMSNGAAISPHRKASIQKGMQEILTSLSMDKLTGPYHSELPITPDRERHLSYQAWHAIQHKQDTADLTLQRKTGMGKSAFQLKESVDEAEQFSMTSGGNQMAPVQRPAEVVQKKLENGKLNIVGEYHSWSDGRRDKEKEFVHQNNLGEYWTENEFKLTRRDGTEGFSDDPYLRALQAAIELVRIAGELISLESDFQRNKELGPDKIVIINTYSIEKIGKMALQVLLNIKNIEENERNQFGDLSYLEKFANIFVEKHKTGQLKLEHIIFVRNKIRDSIMPLLHPTLNSKEPTAITRSIRMLINAELSKKTGVWKVGDAHIPDMELLFNPEENITLTKEIDFRKTLLNFLVAKQKGLTV